MEKPAKVNRASKDVISLRTYYLSEGIPTQIVYSNHMPKFEGLVPAAVEPGLLWGVQGTISLMQADACASLDASRLNRKLFQVELSYRLKSGESASTSVTAESAKKTGYLHCTRLAKAYRMQLHEEMLGWLEKARDPEYDVIAAKDFESLLIMRPMLVHRLMSKYKYLKVVIHPVYLPGKVPIRIAVVRHTSNSIVQAETRFHSEIKTLV